MDFLELRGHNPTKYGRAPGSKSPRGLWLVILGGMRDTGPKGYWTREESIFLRPTRTT